MHRFLFTIMFVALVESAAVAKAKAKAKAPSCPACPACPTPAPTVVPVTPAAGNTSNSSQPFASPTGPPASYPLEDLVLEMLNYTESEDWQAAAEMFAYGMTYITNGQRYDLDLSDPEAVRSIPMRYRNNFVFNRLNSQEVWAYNVVRYAEDNRTFPELLIVHFDQGGYIDVFAHIEPESAHCDVVVQSEPERPRLVLKKVDGSIVEAPQEELQALLERQMEAERAAEEAAAAAAAETMARYEALWMADLNRSRPANTTKPANTTRTGQNNHTVSLTKGNTTSSNVTSG